MQNTEKINKYFERIGLEYSESFEPDLENLKKLHLAHSCTVPYENIDILKGIKLSLDYDDLYEKIVERGCGGYCFELNGLFGWLLRALGYKVTDYLARYVRGEELEVPMRRHRVLRVDLAEGTYIADVGIGDKSPLYPLRLEEGAEQQDAGDLYRFDKDELFGWKLMEKLPDGSWGAFFTFTEEFQADTDFEMPSFWCERHPDSPFCKIPIIAIKSENGLVKYIGHTFSDERGGMCQEREIISAEERTEIIKNYFGLEY